MDRLKFVTNYPKHMTDDLLQAVRDLPKCSPYLHVPAQSGSNRHAEADEARLHGRGLSRDARPASARPIPDAAVTSDFIVGFCGETEDDFQATVELVRESRFKNSFIFKYSQRPGTKSSRAFCRTTCPKRSSGGGTTNCWPCRTRSARKTTSRFGHARSKCWSKAPAKAAQKRAAAAEEAGAEEVVQLVGRSVRDHIVVFDGPRKTIGQILPVRIEKADAFTLYGRM